MPAPKILMEDGPADADARRLAGTPLHGTTVTATVALPPSQRDARAPLDRPPPLSLDPATVLHRLRDAPKPLRELAPNGEPVDATIRAAYRAVALAKNTAVEAREAIK